MVLTGTTNQIAILMTANGVDVMADYVVRTTGPAPTAFEWNILYTSTYESYYVLQSDPGTAYLASILVDTTNLRVSASGATLRLSTNNDYASLLGIQQLTLSNTILPDACISRDVCVLVDGKWMEVGNLYGIVQISAIDADGLPKLVYAKIVKSKTRIDVMEGYRIDGVGYFSHNHALFKKAGANALSTHAMGCSKCCPFIVNGYTSEIMCHMSEQTPCIMPLEHYWYHVVPINPADNTSIFELKCGYYSEFLRTPISDIMDGNEWVLH